MFRRKRQSGVSPQVSAGDLIGVLQSLFPTLIASDENDPGNMVTPDVLAGRLVAVALDQSDIGSSSQWSDLMIGQS